MSFSTEVKNELARVSGENNCCYGAELAALIRMGGAMSIGGNATLGINFSSENAAVTRKVLSLIKRYSNVKTEVMVTRGRRLKKIIPIMCGWYRHPELMNCWRPWG